MKDALYTADITIWLDPNNERLGFVVQRFIMDEPAHFEYLSETGWQREKSHQPTFERAEALAMGHGAIPLKFGHERELIEKAEELEKRARDCIELKAFPTIDRYISEGNRQAALEFSKQVPDSVMRAICFDRAKHHNPSEKTPDPWSRSF